MIKITQLFVILIIINLQIVYEQYFILKEKKNKFPILEIATITQG